MKTIFTTGLLVILFLLAEGQQQFYGIHSTSRLSLSPALSVTSPCPDAAIRSAFRFKEGSVATEAQYRQALPNGFYTGIMLASENNDAHSFQTNTGLLSLAYQWRITRNLSIVSAIGLSITDQQFRSGDFIYFMIPDGLPDVIGKYTSTRYGDAQFGVMVSGRNFIAGYSVRQLFGPVIDSCSLPVRHQFHGYKVFPFKSGINLLFNAMYSYSGNTLDAESMMGWSSYRSLFFSLDASSGSNGIQPGIGFLKQTGLADRIYPRLSLLLNDFKVMASLGIPLKENKEYWSLETGIAYRFPCKPRKRSFRTISCPSFDGGAYGYQSKSARYIGATVPVSSSSGTNHVQKDSLFNTESYDYLKENPFQRPADEPLSTFSIDADNASYANVRRMLMNDQEIPKDAVRIEEFLNYFQFDYPLPSQGETFKAYSEYADCPWNPEHRLLLLGIRAKDVPADLLPAIHLVFLIDVSGSMGDANKLPLLQESFLVLLEKMRPQDKVSIVTYNDQIRVPLEAHLCSDKERIRKEIMNLKAEGSTNGQQGLQKAYELAQNHFIANGNNRIVLATDGDYNIGITSDGDLKRYVEEKRKSGIYISVLGFGMGNLKDSKMEKIADSGNGNYSYIDNLGEARKELVTEFGGTMFTVANDVKIQVEFNPAEVYAYRLIGYENRMMSKEDFNNDQKDAGEIGVNHTVTAIYEIIPRKEGSQVEDSLPGVDPLNYQRTNVKIGAYLSGDLATIKIRYKEPSDSVSKRIQLTLSSTPVALDKASSDFKFACAVTAFGLALRQSAYMGTISPDLIRELAKSGMGFDPYERRADFLKLINRSEKWWKKK